MQTVDLRVGDCREELKKLADCSVDSIVTDPPYHLVANSRGGSSQPGDLSTPYGRTGPSKARGFMGKEWDGGDIAFQVELWVECRRVLKPGGHLLAFSSTRTYHRMACAIEDAGFEIRDQIGWLYGSGFPKSRNIGKELAKMPIEDSPEHVENHDDRFAWLAEMEGWGTALKPAQEPICVARKPMIGTVAQNVLKHGNGGLNIAACRIPADEELRAGAGSTWDSMHGHEGRVETVDEWANRTSGRDGEPSSEKRYAESSADFSMKPGQRGGDPAGRWPANIIHDGSDEVLQAFAQFGEKPGCSSPSMADSEGSIFGGSRTQGSIYPGTGTAARFFYSTQSGGTCDVNTVDANSCLLNQADASVQNLAAIAALHVGKPLSSLIQLFMKDMVSELKKRSEPDMQMIQSIEQKCLRELLLISMPGKTESLANPAEVLALTFTMTIIQSLSNIVGSADAAISTIIVTLLEHGVRVCNPALRRRFIYCAKASREDRNDGCQGFEKKPLNWSSGTQNPGSFQAEGTDKSSQNFHPTVKPTELMRYLCTLVTPPGGLVLDPFMGSGSTGRGARLAGFRFIGIELSPEYMAIAAARIAAAERHHVQLDLMESA